MLEEKRVEVRLPLLTEYPVQFNNTLVASVFAGFEGALCQKALDMIPEFVR